jgi:CubicO group peptidase (beta-lactamase class C family)
MPNHKKIRRKTLEKRSKNRVTLGRVEELKKIENFLEKGVREAVCPGGVLLVAQRGKVVVFEAAGNLSLIPEPVPMKKDTIFDLASLTKPLATTLAIMKLVEAGKIGLDQRLSELIKESPLREKKDLTPRLILNHSAGFADWKPYYLDLVQCPLEERKRVLRERVIEEPLAYAPGEQCLYSDLGFMILEWLIEERAGESLPEYVQQNFYGPLGLERTFFSPSPLSPPTRGGEISHHGSEVKGGGVKEFAATEDCPWRKRVIQGEVHDDNAHAVGGYSGHAGLFGTAEEVYKIVSLLMEHYQGHRDDYFKIKTVKEFFKRQDIVDGCTWALGWDTPSPQDSSSGKYFSPNSVGHLGFTGTSIWIDLEQDVIVILLTNRIHPTRDNEKIKAFRPQLHDIIRETLASD